MLKNQKYTCGTSEIRFQISHHRRGVVTYVQRSTFILMWISGCPDFIRISTLSKNSFIYIYPCMSYVPTYLHTYIHTYIRTYINTYFICTSYVPTYICTYLHITYVHMYILTYIHIIYVLMHICRFHLPRQIPTQGTYIHMHNILNIILRSMSHCVLLYRIASHQVR